MDKDFAHAWLPKKAKYRGLRNERNTYNQFQTQSRIESRPQVSRKLGRARSPDLFRPDPRESD
jgi:hypothetical protein